MDSVWWTEATATAVMGTLWKDGKAFVELFLDFDRLFWIQVLLRQPQQQQGGAISQALNGLGLDYETFALGLALAGLVGAYSIYTVDIQSILQICEDKNYSLFISWSLPKVEGALGHISSDLILGQLWSNQRIQYGAVSSKLFQIHFLHAAHLWYYLVGWLTKSFYCFRLRIHTIL